MGIRGSRLLAVGAAVALLAGCTGGGDGDDVAETTAEPEASPEPDADEPVGDADPPETETDAESDDGPSDGDQRAAPEPLGDPIASVTHTVPDFDDTLVRIDVLGMEIAGELLRLTVAFTPTWTVDPGASLNQLLGGLSASPIGLRLVDPVNLLEYREVNGTNPTTNSIDTFTDIPVVAVYYFAAPVETPETLDIHVSVAQGDHLVPPLTGVPYQP